METVEDFVGHAEQELRMAEQVAERRGPDYHLARANVFAMLAVARASVDQK